MSQGNVVLVRQWFEAWNRGGLPAIRPYYDADVVYHPREDEPEASVHVGRDSFERLIQGFVDSFAEITFDVEQVVDAGDRVVAATILNGRGAASGVEVHEPYVFVYAVRDGLIVEGWEYRTIEEALATIENQPDRARQ
jgi:ketosteroid isomerase-like protein